MNGWPDSATWTALHGAARKAAAHLRLPFHRQSWRGTVGNWMGAGIGSSIDFQDHRPYLPGDDPRYIDWQAYARTGHYIMKLYREEVSPRLDLIFDTSASMQLGEDKAARALELLYFCLESAARAGASVRTYTVQGDLVRPVSDDALRGHRTADFQSLEKAAAVIPILGKLPFRPGSMRVLISDLLYPGEPERLLVPLAATRGRGIVLAPYRHEEAEPPWDGNLELIDCETRDIRIQLVDPALRERYTAAYRRHIDLWSDACRRYGVLLARVPAAPALIDALREDALPVGAAEAWT